ncbi:SpoIVB peptidase [Aureibacillus halotolerans]|uniref:SpoIVB peptidase n=1 Tax=Aureibacillus halotolerans TaxID=1508390 RepID=A0A4V3D5W0_9BACI|nr:SpoIVB peptidase [Aureibacillus halotolerans]TDQ41637.1 SpoIVB peptidase [Aureibacillus halotolerans]
MKKTTNVRKAIGVLLLVLFIGVTMSPSFSSYLQMPSAMALFHNQASLKLPVPNGVDVSGTNRLETDMNQAENTVEVTPVTAGLATLQYRLSGFPIKQSDIRVLKDIRLIPGGQSIGVRLNSGGVLVVGYHDVSTSSGALSPGRSSGLQAGDMILSINNTPVQKMKNVGELVTKAGQDGAPMLLEVKRKETIFQAQLTPAFDQNDQKYRIGLYIKEAAAGIGTMTFYDPESKAFGSLGHVIADSTNHEPVAVYNGELLPSQVTSIARGGQGTPGEKIASFTNDKEPIGSVSKNTPFGVFGTMNKPFVNGIYQQPLPITVSSQVKKGPAKMLTVVDGQKVEAFDIEIVNSIPQKFPATKGMVVKVTDPDLLQRTGGIVQGMSGSPIIQDGKLIGAITHVFVNDPTSGYGIHIEWMLKEAGIELMQEDSYNKAS